MILVDFNKSFQDIILTISESITIDNPVFKMVLKRDATSDVYEFNLGDNLSNGTSRYDLFILPTSAFEIMPVGYYSYSVFQSETDTESLEDGKLLIKGIKELPAEANQTNYIIYNL